ncbi:MAG: anhydro-N-acetylmuramic acid kinase [Bacteroidia bacterium]
MELLNDAFGKFIGESVNVFIDKFSLQKPDIVCSHGHTVFHEPASKFTLQIGNGNIISERTGIICVSDFRSLDVSLGGQGAPLVPVGDQHLFSEYEACLNLGGFSNISFKERGERLAFDICPVNISLNPLANLLNKPFDYNGEIARSGHLQPELLKQLNALPIYKLDKRPSLAREWLEKVFNPVIENTNCCTEDKLRTVTEHVAEQISVVINSRVGAGRVLVTGGGTRNGFLMERLSQLSSVEVVIPNEEILDYKEALIFAFLGVLRMRDQNNVLRSVTGAQTDSCSGLVSHPYLNEY